MSKFVTALYVLALSAFATEGLCADRAEPKTEAAVLAADDDWLAAERRGDVAALDARLAPDYRDVLANGTVHLKAHLMDTLAHLKVKATEPAAKVAADFRAAHPAIETVVIRGDTAILSFHSVDPAKQALVESVDVFTYDHGLWRGVLTVQTGAS